MTKILKVLLGLSLVVVLTFSVAIFGQQAEADTTTNNGKVSIIFTGDMHSHLDAQESVGGFAKLKTIVDDINTKIYIHHGTNNQSQCYLNKKLVTCL